MWHLTLFNPLRSCQTGTDWFVASSNTFVFFLEQCTPGFQFSMFANTLLFFYDCPIGYGTVSHCDSDLYLSAKNLFMYLLVIQKEVYLDPLSF